MSASRKIPLFWCAKATISADLLLRIFTEFNEQRKIYGLVLGGEKLDWNYLLFTNVRTVQNFAIV